MYHTILVPLDGSSLAEEALPLATEIARHAGAAVTLVRVHTLYALTELACSWLPFDKEEDERFRQAEQEYLDAVAGCLRGAVGGSVTAVVVKGMVVDGILGLARNRGADLIVMTTHGSGPISRSFLGSVADELVRRVTVPVLLTRPRETATGATVAAIRSILIPLDGSPASEQVLGPALGLARLTGAACTLLHVIEPSAIGRDSRRMERETEQARRYLEAVAARSRGEAADVTTRLVVGRRAVAGILEEERGHDLIALATRGRGGVKRLLLGSVADKVLRGADAPVLLYRQAETHESAAP